MHGTRPLLSAALVLAIGACSSDGEQTTQQTSIKRFNSASSSYATAAATAHQTAVAAVEAATGGFEASSLTPEAINTLLADRATMQSAELPAVRAAYVADYTDALIAAVQARRALLVASHRFFEASRPLELVEGAGTQTAALRTLPGSGAKVGRLEQPLLFVTIGAIVGAVMVNKALNETMDSVTAKRTEPVRNKIKQANEAELKEIKEELGVDAAASREETLKAFEEQPNHKKLDSAKKTEARLVTAAVETADVEMIAHEEIMTSVVDSATTCGEAAVTQVAGWWATGGGGQGVSEVVKAVGGNATLALLTDIVLTIKGKQPLDVLSNGITKEMKQKTVVGPAPTDPEAPKIETVEQAIAVLEDDKAPGPKVKAAADAVTEDIIEKADVPTTTEADGSKTALVPARSFVQKVETPEETNTVPFLNLGPVDMVVMAPDRIPELLTDVDTAAANTVVEFGNQLVSTFGNKPATNPDPGNGSSELCEGPDAALRSCTQGVIKGTVINDSVYLGKCNANYGSGGHGATTAVQQSCVWDLHLEQASDLVDCYTQTGCPGVDFRACQVSCYEAGIECLETPQADEDNWGHLHRCREPYNICMAACKTPAGG